MRPLRWIAFVTALTGCSPSCRGARAGGDAAAAQGAGGGTGVGGGTDDDPEPALAPSRPPPAPRPPPCVAIGTEWRVALRPGPAAAALPIESVSAIRHADGIWMGWFDRATHEIVVSGPGGTSLRTTTGPHESSGPLLVSAGPALVVVAAWRDETRRQHRVWTVGPTALNELFTQPEATDEGFSITAAATRDGVLIVWSDPREDGHGMVRTQFVSRAILDSGRSTRAPAIQDVAPPEQDSSDPAIVPTADGRAVVLWLSLQELDASDANQTAADVWARYVTPGGAGVGEPVQITPGPANRFGVSGAAVDNGVWVTYRVAGDADQQSLGDGGRVAVLHLGTDLHPLGLPSYLTGLDAVPTGFPRILGAPGASSRWVFWAERRGDATVSLRRRVPQDPAIPGALDESALQGEVPEFGDLSALVGAVQGPRGEPGLARWRCP